MISDLQAGGYVVPAYQAPDDTSWYHFLHGNVPGHQIDFMYRPDVPQGALSRQHFSHLARLMKYIEPQSTGAYAFAIGNLSRDDTQYEPGHGGVSLIFGLRIRGATDHAGRQDPPFAHGIAAIDRELDYTTLLKASLAFSRHVIGAAASAEWYRTYVKCAEISPADVDYVLSGYVSTFGDLPLPPASSMGLKWVVGAAPQPKRIVITHPEDAPFEQIADCAARIAAMLYRSDIRWTSISNGREADVPNGVSIRLFAENSLGPNDAPEGVRRIDEVSDDEAEIARDLFGAKSAEKKVERVLGWRERFGANGAGAAVPEAAPAPAPATPRQAEGESRSWEARDNRPPYVPLEPPPASDEVTELWAGRSEGISDCATGDIDIALGCLTEAQAPAVDGASVAQIQGSEAVVQPAPVAAEPANGERTHGGAAELYPAIVEHVQVSPAPLPEMPEAAPPAPVVPAPVIPAAVVPTPVTPTPTMPMPVRLTPVMPAPVMPAPAMPVSVAPAAVDDVPLTTSTNTLIMKALPDPAKDTVSALASQPMSPVTEWEQVPNFRRPQAPMLRWTLMAMAAAGAVLAILYFVFSDNPSPAPANSSSADTPAASAEQATMTTGVAPTPPPAVPSVQKSPLGSSVSSTSKRDDSRGKDSSSPRKLGGTNASKTQQARTTSPAPKPTSILGGAPVF